MNRLSFIKNWFGLGIFAALITKIRADEPKKWGLVHTDCLPYGSPVDWVVIDNDTGKQIEFVLFKRKTDILYSIR